MSEILMSHVNSSRLEQAVRQYVQLDMFRVEFAGGAALPLANLAESLSPGRRDGGECKNDGDFN